MKLGIVEYKEYTSKLHLLEENTSELLSHLIYKDHEGNMQLIVCIESKHYNFRIKISSESPSGYYDETKKILDKYFQYVEDGIFNCEIRSYSHSGKIVMKFYNEDVDNTHVEELYGAPYEF